MGGEGRLQAYRVKGTNNKVQLLEITVDGRVRVRNLVTQEIFETTKQAFEMAFEPTEYSFLDLESGQTQFRKHQITQSEIDAMIEKAQVEIIELFGKCTIVAVQLANGFILTESTTGKDANSYTKELNTQICLERIKKRIWDLEGYKYQSLSAD